MSLANVTVKAHTAGTGSLTTFAIPFSPVVNDSAETYVYIRDTTVDPATHTLQVEGALNDYTLTGAPDSESFDVNVEFNTAPLSTDIVTIIRVIPLTQTLDLNPSGAFQPTTFEQSMDRLAAQIQGLDEKLRRTPMLPVTEQISEYSAEAPQPGLLLPEPGGGEVIGWNAGGTALVLYDAATFLGATDEIIQDSIGGILADTASIDFTYDDGTPTISAVVLPAGVDHDLLQNFVANEHIDHTSVSILTGTGLSGGGDISSNRTIILANTSVSAASYGGAGTVATFTVDAQGRLTLAGNATISITSGNITDFNEAAQDAVGGILTDTNSVDLTYSDGGNTITADVTINPLTDTVITAADELIFADATDSFNIKKDTVQGILDLATSAASSVVAVSSNDTTPGYLEDKIVSADTKLTVSTLNDGADEDVQLAVNEGNIVHQNLSGAGTNTHTQIDTHIASVANPHSVTIDQITPTDTKGDLIVENATVATKLAIGTDTQILTADSAELTGMKWAAAPAGYTDEEAQDAVGTILTDSSTIDFTYNDIGNTITAVTIDSAIDHDALLNFVTAEHVDWAGASAGTIHATNYVDNNDEYLSGPGVAVVWPDGTSGNFATIAAAYADATIDTVYLMPNEVGGAAHIIDTAGAGSLAITRDFNIVGLGSESSVNLHGNNGLVTDLITVSGAADLTITNVALAIGKILISNTGTGRMIVRHCEATGSLGFTTFVSTTNASGGLIMQDNIATFSGGDCVIVTDVFTCALINNSFVLSVGAAVNIAAGTSVSVDTNTFSGGSPQLKITGGTKVVSRANTYDIPGALGCININGASGVFESQGDVAISGVKHIIVDVANAITYKFRNGSFDTGRNVIPLGQRRPSSYVNDESGLFSNTLKAVTDTDDDANITILDDSNSLGTIMSGAGTKTLNLSPSSGSASSVGSIIASTGNTATKSITGAGGFDIGSVILSGTTITGTISHTGDYNRNLGNIIGSTTLNGTITLGGASCINLMSISNGGTVTIGSSTSIVGSIAAGIVQNGGTVIIDQSGSMITGRISVGTTSNYGAGCFMNTYVTTSATVTVPTTGSPGGNMISGIFLHGGATSSFAGTGNALFGRFSGAFSTTSSANGNLVVGAFYGTQSKSISGNGNILCSGSAGGFSKYGASITGSGNIIACNYSDAGDFGYAQQNATGKGCLNIAYINSAGVFTATTSTTAGNGCALVASVDGDTTTVLCGSATEHGCQLFGFSDGFNITSTGKGGGAFGWTDGGVISNTGINSWQFGTGSNSTNGRFQFYNAAAYINSAGKGFFSGEVEIDGALNHDGTTIGFYGVAPTARPAAYTQTYSTATRVHANLTSAALTDSTGGTTDGTLAAITAVNGSGATTAQEADINNNFKELNDQIDLLRADLLNVKQVLNQVIDDDQLQGLKQ